MTEEFISLNLRPELMRAVSELGYIEPTPIQSAIIPLMLGGADVIGQAQTGTGKTAAFALPILNNLKPGQKYIQALVMCPTRELALQVSQAFSEYGQFCNVRVLAVYGGQPYGPQITRLNKGVDVVVGTPGRMLDLLERNCLNLSRVQSVVLDEADEMLSMGFIDDIETILAGTPPERQTALFSATLPTPIRRLADHYMHNPQSVTIQREQVTVAAIQQRCYIVNGKDKLAALTRIFEMEEVTSALIFVRTRRHRGTGRRADATRGFAAEALNGDLNQDARERTLGRFRNAQIKVLVATDVAARVWILMIFRTFSTSTCRMTPNCTSTALDGRAGPGKPALPFPWSRRLKSVFYARWRPLPTNRLNGLSCRARMTSWSTVRND